MRIPAKKRLFLAAGTAASVGAVATLVSGVTFGLFSASKSQASGPNQFTAGTVTLQEGASQICTVGPIVPGDGTVSPGVVTSGNGEVQCTFPITYQGTVPAYLGLDVAVKSVTAGTDPNALLTGAQGLYDGNQAATNTSDAGLQLLVKDGNGTFIGTDAADAGTHYGTSVAFDTNLAGPTTTNTTTVSDLLLSTTPYTNTGTDTVTVDYFLPKGADNSYQGAVSSIKLTVHAVQSTNNAESGCTTHLVCSTLTWS